MALFIGGLYIGRKSMKKGFLEGLKLGIIFSLFLIIFNYLGLGNGFKLKYILYYTILIISSIFGSIIGINIGEKNTKILNVFLYLYLRFHQKRNFLVF